MQDRQDAQQVVPQVALQAVQWGALWAVLLDASNFSYVRVHCALTFTCYERGEND